ncbi:hypothetical protein QJS66_11555 [Kocuria rhizophila]|nr:hypothetical protein QJS66_11555 [Kocuria rhizophila]
MVDALRRCTRRWSRASLGRRRPEHAPLGAKAAGEPFPSPAAGLPDVILTRTWAECPRRRPGEHRGFVSGELVEPAATAPRALLP